jgi:pseudouridine kinase
MSEISKKEQIYQRIQAHPYISQQELAVELGLSRSAVAGHIASLTRDRRILGRAYVLPEHSPILCIGGANIDRKLRTLAPFTMASSNPVSQEESLGGVARNIAENLARLGSKVMLLTALGDDAAGQSILNQAASLGIEASASLICQGACSGSYTAVLDDAGELLLGLAHMQLCEELTPDFLRSREPQRKAAQIVIADMNLPAVSLRLLLQDAQRSAQTLLLVAVSVAKMQRLPEDLRGLSLLVLNLAELESAAGRPLAQESEIAAACASLQQRGVQHLIVTLGAHGVYHTAAAGLQRLVSEAQVAVDVSGAGDAFSAAVCWSWQHAPHDLALACRRGMQAAALTIQSRATVSPDLHPDFFESAQSCSSSIATPGGNSFA